MQDAPEGLIAVTTLAAVAAWFIIMNHAVLLWPSVIKTQLELALATACMEAWAVLRHAAPATGCTALVSIPALSIPATPATPTRLSLLVEGHSLAGWFERATTVTVTSDGGWEVRMKLGGLHLRWVLTPTTPQRLLCARSDAGEDSAPNHQRPARAEGMHGRSASATLMPWRYSVGCCGYVRAFSLTH